MFFLILHTVCGFNYNESELESEEGISKLYNKWRSHHFVPMNLDETERFKIFRDNAKYVLNTNKKNKTYRLKLNQFADLSVSEFIRKHTCTQKRDHNFVIGANPFIHRGNMDQALDSWDWRENGAVTDVKNQGNCVKP